MRPTTKFHHFLTMLYTCNDQNPIFVNLYQENQIKLKLIWECKKPMRKLCILLSIFKDPLWMMTRRCPVCNGMPSLYHRILGVGTPLARHGNMATLPIGSVWLAGPICMIGGGISSTDVTYIRDSLHSVTQTYIFDAVRVLPVEMLEWLPNRPHSMPNKQNSQRLLFERLESATFPGWLRECGRRSCPET